MNLSNFLAELKRRNVYKVAIAYIVAGWALSQGIAQVFPVFDIPNWAIRMIVLLICVGFPVAIVFAWFFEITTEGIKRTEVADAMPKDAEPHNELVNPIPVGLTQQIEDRTQLLAVEAHLLGA